MQDQLVIPFSVKTVVNTVGWGWLQTFQSSSSTSCQKDTSDWLVNTQFQSSIPVLSGTAKQKQYIPQILTKSDSKKKRKKKRGAVSWSSVTKWHAFIPATSSLGMSLYLSQLSFALLFAFGRKRQETWNISPFFSFFF